MLDLQKSDNILKLSARFGTGMLACLTLFTSPVHAQTAGRQERIQSEQQRLLNEQFRRQDLQRALQPPPQPTIGTVQKTSQESSVDCVFIKDIAFSGNSEITTSDLYKTAKPYLNTCLSLSRIDDLLRTVSDLYLTAGFVTSKAFLVVPQSRLKDGVLQIKIVEGKIDRIDGLSGLRRMTAFPFLTGKILNLRDIEQGLEQINRLPSNHAAMEIVPSNRTDYSAIVITNTPDKRNTMTATTDNAGAESTGDHRVGVKFARDDAFGLNDALNLSYTKAPSKNSKRRDANYFTAGYSVPIGYWTLTDNFSYSDYRTAMTLSNGIPFYSFGDSRTNTFVLERLMFRGQRYKLSAQASVTGKSAKNYTEVLDFKTRNDASTRKLTTVAVGLSGTFFRNGGVLYLNPSYVQGVRWFGALNDKNSGFEQRAQYRAAKIYAYASQSFNYGFSFTSTVDGQYSKDKLFASESVFAGGEYSVRGFKNEGMQGDSGVTLRNDLNWKYGFLSLGAFFDWGTVKSNTRDSPDATLSGAGVKAAVSTPYIALSATYAKPLHRPAPLTENKAWYLSAAADFRF